MATFPLKRLCTALVCAVLLVGVSYFSGSAPLPALAQAADCPNVVQQAFDTANGQCQNMGRNQMCYAHPNAFATGKPGVNGFNFNKPGDKVNLGDLASLKLGRYNKQEGTWGVAVMRVQANLPDSAPGQNVIMIVFGDTQVADAGGNGPMQAFYMRTGTGKPGCRAMPQSGMLIQTPKGGQKVELVANGVQLSIGSTVFLTAPGKTEDDKKPTLWVYTVEGSVDVTSDGVTVTVPGGTQTCVPLDDQDPNDPLVLEDGPPCQPRRLNQGNVTGIPRNTSNTLAETVPPTPAPPECAITSFSADVTSAAPRQPVTISWNTTGGVNAELWTPGGGDIAASGLSGSFNYSAGGFIEGTGDETWELRLTCADGSTRNAFVTVNVSGQLP